MATTGNPVSGPTKSYVPDGAIAQGTVVVFSGTTPGHVLQSNTVGAQGVGIADTPGTPGVALRVTRQGDALVTAGGPVSIGQYCKSDGGGRLIAVTGTPGGGENVVGRAESPAVAAGDTFVLYVQPFVL